MDVLEAKDEMDSCMKIKSKMAKYEANFILRVFQVIPTLDMAVNEMFFERYPDTVLSHQIQVRPFNADKTRNMRALNPEDIDQVRPLTKV